jgi:RNA polymerase sigma-70 factor (ECF subfamily)
VSECGETEILLEAQAGDYEAFDRLHSALEPAILRFVRRFIANPETAEDIVQDTFLALYLHLDKVDPPEKLRPYVYRIARNKCYDELRKMGRYEQVSLDDEPVQVRVSFNAQDYNGTPPDEAAHWLLLHLEVQEAMNRLPDLQREALILYSEEQMTYAEIADVMDCSVGTIKSRIHHAKRNLRGLLNPNTLEAIMDEIESD